MNRLLKIGIIFILGLFLAIVISFWSFWLATAIFIFIGNKFFGCNVPGLAYCGSANITVISNLFLLSIPLIVFVVLVLNLYKYLRKVK